MSLRLNPRILQVALAGALLPLAFAPFYWWWLTPLAYAALFLAWQGASPRQAFRYGWVFGCAQFLLGTYWIVISVHGYGEAPIWLAVFLMLGLVAIMALYPALVGWVAARWFRSAGAGFSLGALPALFVLAEWLRGWLLTGFGWLSPGYAQTDSWLAGFAPVFGVLGTGWAVLLVAGAMTLALSGVHRARLIALVVVVGVLLDGFVLSRISWTEAKSESHSVALVQGAVDQELKWLPEQLPDTLGLYRRLTIEALGSDLIIWPEAAIPDYHFRQRAYFAELEQLASAAGSELMFGMLRFDAPTVSTQNAVFVLSQPDTVYIKRHLVPYGEYFPVPGFIRDWLRSMELPNIDTAPGDEGQRPIALLDERIAVTICYEDVFGTEQLHSFPDASLLVNVSNDGWFGDSIAPHQHLQIARMRSLEVGRWQLRSTNTGVTALINPKGRVESQLLQFEPGVLRGNVTGMTGATPYVRWGNWPVLLMAAAVVIAVRLAGRRAS